MHIHVEKDRSSGKIWLEPEIIIAYMHKFSPRQVQQIMVIVTVNYKIFKIKWNEYFT